jgi:hypothetical protein
MLRINETMVTARATITATGVVETVFDSHGRAFQPREIEAVYLRDPCGPTFVIRRLFVRGPAIRRDGTLGSQTRFRAWGGERGASVQAAPLLFREWAIAHLPATDPIEVGRG